MAWYEKATDDFNRANENPLSKGGMWSRFSDRYAMQVSGNTATLTAFGQFNFSIYNGVSFGSNQYVQSTIVNQGFIGHVLRASGMPGAAGTFYFIYWNAGNSQFNMVKSIAGVQTAVGAAIGGTASAGTFRSEVVGSNFSVTRNGIVVFTRTDSSIAMGYPGITLNDTPAVHDDFSAGDDVAPWLLRSPFPFPHLS